MVVVAAVVVHLQMLQTNWLEKFELQGMIVQGRMQQGMELVHLQMDQKQEQQQLEQVLDLQLYKNIIK
jgi:hypothetical protein